MTTANAQAYLIVREIEPIAPGSSVDLVFVTKDESGGFIAHVAPLIDIYRPDLGTKAVDEGEMTPTGSTGVSVYNFSTTDFPEGTYLAVARGTLTIGLLPRVEAAKAKFLVSLRKPSVTV